MARTRDITGSKFVNNLYKVYYDLKNKTDVFTSSIVVDEVAVQQFEHIPEYARKLIICNIKRHKCVTTLRHFLVFHRSI